MSKKVYISGKISGLTFDEACNNFMNAENEVIEMGDIPVNPMSLNHSDHDQSWQAFMKVDVKALCDCDAIYMQTNWKDSHGAKAELEIAKHLELEIIFQHRLIAVRRQDG